jgi:hypothetical protein
MPSKVCVFTGNGIVDDVAEESLSNSDASVAGFGSRGALGKAGVVGEADNDNADAVYGLSGEASVNARRDRPRHNRNTGSLAGRCWLNVLYEHAHHV